MNPRDNLIKAGIGEIFFKIALSLPILAVIVTMFSLEK
jgi:hypothetical protein